MLKAATKSSIHGKPQSHKPPSNTVYRKAILKAIEDLHDCHLRSNVDAIRRHVISELETDCHNWNEVLFMKTLKAVVQDGEVEQQTFVNCALSPEYKRRRANSLTTYIEHQKKKDALPYVPGMQQPPGASQPAAAHHDHSYPPESPKQAPKRKVEHDKYKIIPKPLFDQTIIQNPMDTH